MKLSQLILYAGRRGKHDVKDGRHEKIYRRHKTKMSLLLSSR